MTKEVGDSMTAQRESVVSMAVRARRSAAAPDGVVPRPRAAAGTVARRLDVVPQQLGPQSLAQTADALELDPITAAWVEFKSGAGRLVRERLILHYAPLVTAVASRVGMRLPSSVEQADLVSYGMFGLIDAIEKYELDRAVKFETYASARIRGAIIDELRAMDWVPRSVRTKARAVDRAYAELESELHRTPSEAEVAGRLELGVGELRAVFTQLSTVNVVALDELIGSGAEDPAGSFEVQETKFLLARAIEQLGEREKIVLVLYYYEGMTLAEIGRVLGVTESRISQMHTAAMLRLRAMLSESERS
jgi:RNA polymerase sigma factor for flagellar operon FliA